MANGCDIFNMNTKLQLEDLYFPLVHKKAPELSTVPKLHVIKGCLQKVDPDTTFTFLLIHGGEKRAQNSNYWAPLYEFFSSSGTFYAVENIEHTLEAYMDTEKTFEINKITALSNELKNINDDQIVLVARASGVRMAIGLVKKNPHKFHSLIFIAPDLKEREILMLPQEIKETHLLIVWSKDDPITSFSNFDTWAFVFPGLKEEQNFEKEIQPGKHQILRSLIFDHLRKPNEEWRAHIPELEHIEEFTEAASIFLSNSFVVD